MTKAQPFQRALMRSFVKNPRTSRRACWACASSGREDEEAFGGLRAVPVQRVGWRLRRGPQEPEAPHPRLHPDEQHPAARADQLLGVGGRDRSWISRVMGAGEVIEKAKM